MRLVLVGPPLTGKSTLGKKLSDHFNIPIVNVGKELREIPASSDWYEEINGYMQRGELAPPKLVGGLIEAIVAGKEYKDGYILDGWLRQLPDLEHFDPDPTFVLYLNISEDVSRRRIEDRLVCLAHGHTYSKSIKKPKVDGICDIDGSPLTHRKDDYNKVLDTRIKIFYDETIPVLDFYRKKGKLIEIDAEPLPDVVLNSAIEVIRLKIDSMI